MSLKKGLPSFIEKLWSLLEEQIKLDQFICWTKSGLSFAIVNQKRFCEAILPQYFRHSNFTSFVRQLNMYNFHKIKVTGDFEFQFEHELFRKGYKELLFGIKRKPSEHDLIHGRELLKKLNLKDINEEIQKQSEQKQPPQVIKQIKMQNNDLSQNQSTHTFEELLIQNRNLKQQNIFLSTYLNSLKTKEASNIKKTQLLLQGLQNNHTPVTQINFKHSDFLKHLQSQQPPLNTSAHYLKFWSVPINNTPQHNIFWQMPIIFTPSPIFSTTLPYYFK